MMMLNAATSARVHHHHQQPPPSCAICRTVGASQHYGVLTCSACMNFFRRTVTENLKYHCLDGGSCIVAGAENRTKCRQCRWARCLQMGMKPECIGGPQQHHHSFSSGSSGSSASISPSHQHHSGHQQRQHHRQHHHHHHQRQHMRRISDFRSLMTTLPMALPSQSPAYPPPMVPLPMPAHLKQQPILSPPPPPEQEHSQPDPLYSDPYLYHLSSIDIRSLRPPSSPSSSSLTAAATASSESQARLHVDTWLGLIDSFVAELIRWCKDLSGFCNLPAADQSALIRANGTKLLCLQVLCNSLPYQGRLRICSGVSLHQFDSGFCSRRLFKRMVSVCQFATEMRLCYAELLLLRPIFLLDPPAHLQLVGQGQVRDLQASFLTQLTRVCPGPQRREQMLLLNRELAECWRLILEHIEALMTPVVSA